ncbi:SusC/RagA family TonB-linked outer membrane protein [Pontibacter sp. SGAir0037]|uniref:SusC/RagA family TonB-linked outer membrane protein n=1 Tax=Pontibacter sp. SGAir0037 TaxID=2571030 RepID=UPI0010CD38BF|nr:SusC/RagA family TonB-linked outer membrane protein [Pontibacter sp. SGAir0037]QCR23502.1 SusC/RagA family TonB-linked outer membrane protein [Pontibacter sp. SGAir0037]
MKHLYFHRKYSVDNPVSISFRKLKYTPLLVVLMLLQSIVGFAQTTQTITGKIISAADNSGLPGVSVRVKGTTTGAVTNVEGNFTLQAAENAVLQVSYIGYVTQEVSVNGRSQLTIALAEDQKVLSEVVVTALGIERETKSLGYAVSEVSNEQITGNGETNPISSLAGKVAGVNVSGSTAGPTGSNRVVIRGIRELNGNNQPLYVIDGVPAVNGNVGGGVGTGVYGGGYDTGDGLSDINPNDIESISVLKGSAAAALYGSRALNGVILITTKSGKNRKGLGVELNSNTTIDQISTVYKDRQQTYGQGQNGVFPRDAINANDITQNWGPRFGDPNFAERIQADGSIRPYQIIDDNAQSFYRTGRTLLNTVAVVGGNEETNFRASYSNTDIEDVFPQSGVDRNNITLRASSKISKGLTVDGKVALTDERVRFRPALGDELNNIGNALAGLALNFDQEWLRYYENESGAYIPYSGDQYRANPYWTLNRTNNASSKRRVNGLLNVGYKFNDMFNLNLQAGTDFFRFSNQVFEDIGTPTRVGGSLNLFESNVSETNYQGIFNFNKDVTSDITVGASFGGNIMRYRSEGTQILGTQAGKAGGDNITNFANVNVTPIPGDRDIYSVFATANFSFRDYLFFSLQGRQDWASTLTTKENTNDYSFFYPAVDASLVLTDALDIKSDVLSFGKIRAAYGQVGSDFSPYQTNFAYRLTGRYYNGMPMGEILGTTIPNANLRPQIKTSFELGADVRLFLDKVGIDFTFYNEVTSDVLLQIPVPTTTGFERAALNAGELKNTGVEILLRTTPVELANGFRWDLSVNFAKNRNEVVQITNELDAFVVDQARWASAQIVAQVGRPFGTIVGPALLRDAQGRIVHDASGLPMRTQQEDIVLGETLADWTGGLTNSFSYKGFELRGTLDIRKGGDIYSMTNRQMYQNGSHIDTEAGRESWNEYQQAVRAYQDANPGASSAEVMANVPQNGRGFIGAGVNENGEANTVPVSPSAYWNAYAQSPEGFIYDGSYIKLRDLGLNYTFDRTVLKGLPIQSITVGVIGRNLAILYKNVPNIDPESSYNNSNGQGFEYGSLPARRRYGVNLVVRF